MAETLEQYIEDFSVNMSALARKIGISPVHMQQIVRGKVRPSPEVAVRIEAITGIPLRRLLGLGESSAVSG